VIIAITFLYGPAIGNGWLKGLRPEFFVQYLTAYVLIIEHFQIKIRAIFKFFYFIFRRNENGAVGFSYI
jgi:hypothetical protein